MNKFEVGKSYGWAEIGYDRFTVLSRTEKTITVSNGLNRWRMLVRTDDQGEFVRDSSYPKYAQDMLTSRPEWIEDYPYGYLIDVQEQSGKRVQYGMSGYTDAETCERYMNWMCEDLPKYGRTVLAKRMTYDGKPIS